MGYRVQRQMKRKTVPACPVETTMLFLKDRAATLIVGYLLLDNTDQLHLQKKINIKKRTLEQSIDDLCREGICRILPDGSLELTEFGRSLQGVVDAMAQWGEQYKTQQNI